MDLSTIRKKLQKEDQLHYTSSEELVADVRLMFWNCGTFNYVSSSIPEFSTYFIHKKDMAFLLQWIVLFEFLNEIVDKENMELVRGKRRKDAYKKNQWY